jgi:hypothetical protein
MMTRAQTRQKDLDDGIRLVENIFPDDPELIQEALKSQNLLRKSRLLRATRKNLEDCRYKDTAGNGQPILRTDIDSIMVLQAYSKYRKNMQDLITDWTKVTEEDLADFMQLGYYDISNDKLDLENIKRDYEKKVATITNGGASSNHGNVAMTITNASAQTDWNRGMRMDSTLFPTLDNLNDYVKWESSTLDIAASQNIKQVFDKTYSPTPGSLEADLFEKKKEFVSAVFIDTWTLWEGLEILRCIKDPQKAFTELQSQAHRYINAKVEADSIKEELRVTKLGNTSFAGTTEEFVARIYERISDHDAPIERISDHDALMEDLDSFSESQRKEILRSCVETNDDLCGMEQLKLKDVADDKPYKQYYTMLIDQARRYDGAQNGGKENREASMCHLANHAPANGTVTENCPIVPSTPQMKSFGVKVHELPKNVGGLQHIFSSDGHVFPGDILKSDVCNHNDHGKGVSDEEFWCDTISSAQFDPGIDYQKRIVSPAGITVADFADEEDIFYDTQSDFSADGNDSLAPTSVYRENDIPYFVDARNQHSNARDFEAKCSPFAWVPMETIKKPFEATTQFARLLACSPSKLRSKSPFSNIRHCNGIAIETIASDTNATHENQDQAVTNTLTDRTGTPGKFWFICLAYVCFLLKCVATEFPGWKASLFLATDQRNDFSMPLCFSWYQPFYLQQFEKHFPSHGRKGQEHFVGTSKHLATVYRYDLRSALDLSETDPCLDDVFDGENVTAKEFIRSLRKHVWQAAEDYNQDDSPSGTCGDGGMTMNSQVEDVPSTASGYEESQVADLSRTASEYGEQTCDQIIERHGRNNLPPERYQKNGVHVVYVVKHGKGAKARLVANGYLMDVPVETVYSGVVSFHRLHLIVSLSELNDLEIWANNIRERCMDVGSNQMMNRATTEEHGERTTEVSHPSDLIGRSFLLKKRADGFRAKIVVLIELHKRDHRKELNKFCVSINNDQPVEVLDYIDERENDGPSSVLRFESIISHQGPLRQSDLDYAGSSWNATVQLQNGEVTTEPLSIPAKDTPVLCSIYARNHGLLDFSGWQRYKSLARGQKKFLRLVNQAKLHSYRTAPKYQYGYEVPRNCQHAIEIDKKNGTTNWKESTALEMSQLKESQTSRIMGMTTRLMAIRKFECT